jgi:hypothetical protein
VTILEYSSVSQDTYVSILNPFCLRATSEPEIPSNRDRTFRGFLGGWGEVEKEDKKRRRVMSVWLVYCGMFTNDIQEY